MSPTVTYFLGAWSGVRHATGAEPEKGHRSGEGVHGEAEKWFFCKESRGGAAE